jgi:hypothetical protein
VPSIRLKNSTHSRQTSLLHSAEVTRDLVDLATLVQVVGFILVRVEDYILVQAVASTLDQVEDSTLAPEAVCIQDQVEDSTLAPEAVCIQDQVVAFIPAPEADCIQGQAGGSTRNRPILMIRGHTKGHARVLLGPKDQSRPSRIVLNESPFRRRRHGRPTFGPCDERGVDTELWSSH